MKTFFLKFGWSISDQRFGLQVVGEKTSDAMKYLFIVMLLLGSIVMTKGVYEIDKGVEHFSRSFEKDVPNFELREGNFICNIDTPYVKVYGNSIFVIDVTGQITSDTLKYYTQGMFLDKTALTYKNTPKETRKYDWMSFKNLNFTKYQLQNNIATFKYPALVLIFALGIAFIFALKLMGVLIVSLIALIINAIMKTEIEFAGLFRLSIYAVVLPTILDKGLDLFGINIHYFFVLYYLLAAFFLYRYLKGCREEQQ